MNIQKMEEQYQYREENMKIYNKNKMQEILKYLFYLCQQKQIKYQTKENYWDTFIVNYKNLHQKGAQRDIHLFMKQNGATLLPFLYEALHYDFKYLEPNPPIKGQDNIYSWTIQNKKFKFAKATEYFENSQLKEIFQKKTEKECFARTLDLARCIKESKAVVSYLPNLLKGGYYHAYLKCPNGILIDPASNLVMLNHNAKQLLAGEIIFEMNYEEIQNSLKTLTTIEKIEDYKRPKLLKLALFIECSKIEQIESMNNTSTHRR